MLICARIRYVTSDEWSTRRYLDMRPYRQRTDHRHRDGRRPKCARYRALPFQKRYISCRSVFPCRLSSNAGVADG